MAREIGKKLGFLVKFESKEEFHEGCKGFATVCNGLEEDTTAWHGSKSGAENLAGWKWLKVICNRFLVEKKLYRQLVKKFTFSLVDVDTSCRICKSPVELDELWDHVEKCMEVRCLNHWGEKQTSEKVECPICEKSFSLIEFGEHAERCKWDDCEICGEKYKKMEKRDHMLKCEPAVVTLIECPNCPERLEMKDVERHLRECSERMRIKKCKICGEREERGHNCHECPICLEKKPVKDWVIFRRCGHVVCRACSRRLVRHDNGKKVVCVNCREESYYPLKRIFL